MTQPNSSPPPQPWKVPISRPQLPDFGRYEEILRRIWESHLLSNFGPVAMDLEAAAAAYLGNPNTRLLSTCDIGLTLTVAAQRIPRGKKALLPSFTFGSTVNAAIWNGLEPVFCDLNPWDFCVDPAAIWRLVDDDTGLIMATHIFGNPCRVDDIEAIAEEARVPVVYDAAHAYGADYQGRKVGSLGDNAVFSLSGTKLVTSGEGGIVAPANEEIAERLRFLRGYGFVADYNTQATGLNAKMSELHAALGLLSLELTEGAIAARHLLVERYKENLRPLGAVRFQGIAAEDRSTYNYFGIVCEHGRDGLAERLTAAGVQVKKYFLPAHLHDAFRQYARHLLPSTDRLFSQILVLPLYNELAADTVDWISEMVTDYYARATNRRVMSA